MVLSGTGAFYTTNGNLSPRWTGYSVLWSKQQRFGTGLPNGHDSIDSYRTLNFWFNCSSSEGTTTAYDFLYVRSPQYDWHIALDGRDLQQQG
jgi:hypothetical protein